MRLTVIHGHLHYPEENYCMCLTLGTAGKRCELQNSELGHYSVPLGFLRHPAPLSKYKLASFCAQSLAFR